MSPSAPPLANPTADHFRTHLGSIFRLEEPSEGLSIELVLSEILSSDLHARPFSLIFDGPADVHLAQRIYSLSHSALADTTLFLVPIEGNETRRRYEALFN
jgi:hypothetical protein